MITESQKHCGMKTEAVFKMKHCLEPALTLTSKGNVKRNGILQLF